MIERSVALSKHFVLQPTDLPDYIQKISEAEMLEGASEKRLRLKEFERMYIKKILQDVKGDREKTAAILGISKRTLYRKT